MADVGCAGILVADTICGPLDALPVEGQLLLLDSMPTLLGGCAGNVAVALRKHGISVDVSGCLGNDPYAKIIIDLLSQVGVGCERITYTDLYPTSQTCMLIVKGQDRRFIHVFGANKAFSVSHIDRDWLSTLKVFYVGGLFAVPSIKMDELRDALAFCKSKGVATIVDVVVPHYQRGLEGLDLILPYTDYFLPNDDEAALLTGKDDPLEQIKVFQANGANTVIITRGEKGCVAARGKDVWRSGVFTVDTIDPSGGGDAFDTGVIIGMLRGWDMPQLLTFASAMGASATLGIGTTAGIFTADQIDPFLKTHTLELTHERLG